MFEVRKMPMESVATAANRARVILVLLYKVFIVDGFALAGTALTSVQ
jgi:hypothetical protein